jgi:hypothetical protein
MKISGVSLALPWPHRVCLLRVLLGFPLSKHTGGSDTEPAFSGLHVYLQFTWEVGLPPLLWSFPPTTTFTSFPTPDCWACAAAPAGQGVCLQLMWEVGLPPHFHKLSHSWLLGTRPYSHPLWPGPGCLFTFLGGIPLPHFGAQGAPPSLLRVFIVLIAYYSVSLFSLGGGQSVQGAMLIWPRDVFGSTAYHLAHLVVRIFPIHLGAGNWQRPGGPPGFSIQHEVEMFCAGWSCGGVKVFPLFSGFACKVCLQRLSKISL